MGTANPFIRFEDSQFARAAQNRIIPAVRPSIPGLDYYSDWRPGSCAGGDYLDYFDLDGGNFALAIGDVSAGALESALLTTSLHSIVRALGLNPSDNLADFASSVAGLFREVCPDDCYATLFLARYDPVVGQLHYVNAGHEPPLVLRKASQQYREIRLETGGPLLGMLRKSRYREGVISLGPGDLLVAYTDGLCDAKSPEGEEWGWRRFLDTLHSGPLQRAREVVSRAFDAQACFTAAASRQDDMTLWVGRVEERHALPILHLMESVEEPAAA